MLKHDIQLAIVMDTHRRPGKEPKMLVGGPKKAIFLLQKAKKLDMAVARALHAGYQRTGAIKPSTVSAMATAAAAAASNGVSGGTMRQVYKSKWLREKEAAMATDLENEYRDNLLLPAKPASE
jgi:hypothetical protein